MEIFAFTQNSVGYEDPGAEPQLRSFDEINLEIPKSAMIGAAGLAAATVIMGHSPDAHAIVYPGDTCAAVGRLQQALNSAGFAAGAVDNVFGSQTKSAVMNFQRQQGLTADGIAGPATANALGFEVESSAFDAVSGCGSAPIGGGGTFTVTASVLNVRAQPSLSSIVITSLPRGTTVNIAETSGDWARLTGQTGWVSRSYLSAGGGTTPPVGGGGTYTVTASVLNVRETPSLSSGVITSLPRGTTVNIAETSGDWARLSGQTGWVSRSYLSAGGDTTPPVGGGGSYTVKASAVNVRATPSTSGDVITTLYNGTSVNISSVNSQGWAKLANQAGWVAFYLLD
ncbi:MAG: SH3 domain-containing protein [Elainellaceae cyanobacterium]